MGLLDTFTGGKSDQASDDFRRAEEYLKNVQTPTLDQLTLPELQKYVEAGILTPAQAQAYLQQSNAYADMNVDQTGTGAQIQALNQLSQVANAGGEGTPTSQAGIENAISQMNTSVGGQRGAIEQAMAARGTPYALIQAALQNQTVGQDAQQAHMDAVNAHAASYQQALNAMAQGGQLGNTLQGQQNTQANTVAGAQNAMQQFNAANQQNASEANAGRAQEANQMNLSNKQQIANNNTGLANSRTEYNANLPQQMFNNSMQKASGMAGAAQGSGQLNQLQGQQNAGITSGLINLGASFIPTPAGKTKAATANAAHGGYVDENGRMCMADGGMVPGESMFPGDTEMNDLVPANLSPGEAVIPRSSVQENPEIVSSLMHGDESGDVQDVATLLKALRSIRMGV